MEIPNAGRCRFIAKQNCRGKSNSQNTLGQILRKYLLQGQLTGITGRRSSKLYIIQRFIGYMAQPNYTIATIGSHSALQVFKGAHDEGFKTISVCKKGFERPYKMFNAADEIISIDSYKDFPKVQDYLIKKNAIIIPHGSFVTYMGYEEVEKLKVMYYRNKKILKWESDRHLERQWLVKAGLKVPLLFKSPKDIDRLVIAKFMGAEGGKGYFLAKNEKDFNKKIKPYKLRKYIIQEYIIGVPLFIHSFYSSLQMK